MDKRLAFIASGHLGYIAVVATLLTATATVGLAAAPHDRIGRHVPDVPANLEVPAGHAPFLIARATGTQNYICQTSGAGFAWKLFGPQATLFHEVYGQPWQQVATHYLSANPDEGGLARPTWQHSIDSSRVWGRAAASSTDPTYVRFDAIAWLLVEVVGAAPGTLGSRRLSQTTFIQRVNTEGGLADPTTCTDFTQVGSTVLVPYETDYVFYRAARGH